MRLYYLYVSVNKKGSSDPLVFDCLLIMDDLVGSNMNYHRTLT